MWIGLLLPLLDKDVRGFAVRFPPRGPSFLGLVVTEKAIDLQLRTFRVELLMQIRVILFQPIFAFFGRATELAVLMVHHEPSA